MPTRTPVKKTNTAQKSSTSHLPNCRKLRKSLQTKRQRQRWSKSLVRPPELAVANGSEEESEDELVEEESAGSKAGGEGSSKAGASNAKRAKKSQTKKTDGSDGEKSHGKAAANGSDSVSNSPRRSPTPQAEQASDGDTRPTVTDKVAGAHLEVPKSGEAGAQKSRKSPSPALKSAETDGKDGTSDPMGKRDLHHLRSRPRVMGPMARKVL